MTRIYNYSFVILSLLYISLLAIAPAVTQERIMKEGDTFVVEIQRPTQVDTGITIEAGIKLTSEELQAVVKGGSIPVKTVEDARVWGKYYLYRVVTRFTSQEVTLAKGGIKRVEANKIETIQSFNPFFLLGIIYIFLMYLVSRIKNRFAANGLAIFSAFAAVAVVGNIFTTFPPTFVSVAAATFATFAVAAATFATFAVAANIDIGQYRKVSYLIGIGSMIVAMVITFFN